MKDGSYYEGEFKNGEIDGHGFRFYASSKHSYSGAFHQGEPQGQGVMRYNDGSVYEGEWRRSKREGETSRTFLEPTNYSWHIICRRKLVLQFQKIFLNKSQKFA